MSTMARSQNVRYNDVMKLRRAAGSRPLCVRGLTVLLVGVILAWPLTVLASQSTNYQINEDFVGGLGGTYSSSTNYQSIDSGGTPAVGDSASTNYQIKSGATTTDDPNLSFAVNTGSVSLGALSTGTTATATATFNVMNYTSYGYIVQVFGATPTYSGHSLTAMSGTTSVVGSEQFGINLAANTLPINFGADPVQVPNSSFSYGTAATGYNTANTYRYTSGDTIAQATKSSGQTTYTIAYVANMAGNTPPGAYSGSQTLICTGTY